MNEVAAAVAVLADGLLNFVRIILETGAGLAAAATWLSVLLTSTVTVTAAAGRSVRSTSTATATVVGTMSVKQYKHHALKLFMSAIVTDKISYN